MLGCVFGSVGERGVTSGVKKRWVGCRQSANSKGEVLGHSQRRPAHTSTLERRQVCTQTQHMHTTHMIQLVSSCCRTHLLHC